MTIIRNEFDKRIIDPSTIQSFKQYDDKYVGVSGYFSDNLCRFQCLKSCCKGILTSISNEDCVGDFIFVNDSIGYRYFLPESLLNEEKPKKYRAFSLEEFLNTFKIGDVITYRAKGSNRIEHHLFTGYVSEVDVDNIPGIAKIMLGNPFGLGYLFTNDYELFLNGKWQPFGVVDK